MTIPTHVPTICDWCGSTGAYVENVHHPKYGRFIFAFCDICDWVHEYDQDEGFDLDPEQSYEDFQHDLRTAYFDADAHE